MDLGNKGFQEEFAFCEDPMQKTQKWILCGKKLAIQFGINWEFQIPGWFRGEEVALEITSKEKLEQKGFEIFYFGPFSKPKRMKFRNVKIKSKSEEKEVYFIDL